LGSTLQRKQGASSSWASWLDRRFKITERGSTLKREILGGGSTFFAMAYILVLNAIILGGAADVSGNQLNMAQIVTSTALVAGVMTILMGAVANFPLAIAAGLGLNGVVAFQLAGVLTWPEAMGVVVLEGLIITVLVLTGIRPTVFRAVPEQLKISIGVGIGLFLAFIGFVDAGFVRRPEAGLVPVSLGSGGRLLGWPSLVFALGVILIVVLLVRRVRGAILLGIVGTTVFALALNALVDIPPLFGAEGAMNPRAWMLTVPEFPGWSNLLAMPDFGLLGQFSLFGSFARIGVISAVLFVFTLMLADFFDTMGTMVAVGGEANMLDKNGEPPQSNNILLVDSLAAVAGGAASASSNTSYIESGAGVADGARTGLASIVTGLAFLAAMFVSPLVAIVPQEAAAAALVVVGFLMTQLVKRINWQDLEIAIPAFFTIVMMPFTFSITNGIGAGFVLYALLRLVNGKAKQTHWMLYVIAAAFILYFAIEPLENLLGV
jgi:AGZA family xanthine/uracil permease-like MFS transporter